MKKLNSIIFYALVTPAITLGATSVLAQQSTTKNDQNTPRTSQAESYKETDRNKLQAKSRMQDRGYLNAVPANGTQASNLIGAEVKTTNDEDLGSVEDLIIDSNGQVVAIVVSVGGFLGMGEKDVAVSWNNVTKTGQGDDQKLRVDVNRDALKAAPVFAKRD